MTHASALQEIWLHCNNLLDFLKAEADSLQDANTSTRLFLWSCCSRDLEIDCLLFFL